MDEILKTLVKAGIIDPRDLVHAPGVVGKTNTVVLGLMAVFGVAAWRLGDHPWFVVGDLALAIFVTAGYFVFVIYFVRKYPAEMLLSEKYYSEHLKSKNQPVILAPPETLEPEETLESEKMSTQVRNTDEADK